jgi:tRNA (guanine37-N1)-methyltransferase
MDAQFRKFEESRFLVGLEIKDEKILPHVINILKNISYHHNGIHAIQKIQINGSNEEKYVETKIFLFAPETLLFDDYFTITESTKAKFNNDTISILDKLKQKKNLFQIPEQLLNKLYEIKKTFDENNLEIDATENRNWIFENFNLHPVEVKLTTKNFTTTELLKKLLPSNVTIPSGFEQIGHIAHVNLLDSQLEYKYIIGEVFLQKNIQSGVKVVVNKLGSISSEFREFKMEVIASLIPKDDPNIFNTEVKHHGIIFSVPFDKVYWNSRLEYEHKRFIDSLLPNDILYDVMAGVGPFAIPAAKKGLTVYANDLNPVAVNVMRFNWIKNKGKNKNNGKLEIFNMDGRLFIDKVRKEHLNDGPIFFPVDPKNPENKKSKIRHFIMNLPALAVKFLDAFTGPNWSKKNNPMIDHSFIIHVYLFSVAPSIELAKKDSLNQIIENLKIINSQDHLNNFISNYILDIYFVRDIAPSKYMLLVSFKFPTIILDP